MWVLKTYRNNKVVHTSEPFKTKEEAKAAAQQFRQYVGHMKGVSIRVVKFRNYPTTLTNPGFIKCKAVRVRKSGKGFKLDILK